MIIISNVITISFTSYSELVSFRWIVAFSRKENSSSRRTEEPIWKFLFQMRLFQCLCPLRTPLSQFICFVIWSGRLQLKWPGVGRLFGTWSFDRRWWSCALVWEECCYRASIFCTRWRSSRCLTHQGRQSLLECMTSLFEHRHNNQQQDHWPI